MSLLPDAAELVKAIKRAALDAVESIKPVGIYFGEVQGVSPLKINVEQKLILGEKQLILSRNVTDFKTNVTVNWETESELGSHSHTVNGNVGNGGEPTHSHSINVSTSSKSLSHSHAVSGKKEITVHNALQIGDKVILLRQQEGQKYVVVDRVTI
ncbi:MAG: DUF2577 domain-containing protein [Lachnospiraceae bacterium]